PVAGLGDGGGGAGLGGSRWGRLARIASPISTRNETSATKASEEASTRAIDPKEAASVVPRVRAEKNASATGEPISTRTNRATTRLYATTRTTAKRLIWWREAFRARGPPRIVTGSR